MVVLFGRTRRYNTNHFLPYPYLSAFAFTRRRSCACGPCTRVVPRARVRATAHNHASHAPASASSSVERVHATPLPASTSSSPFLSFPLLSFRFLSFRKILSRARHTCRGSDLCRENMWKAEEAWLTIGWHVSWGEIAHCYFSARSSTLPRVSLKVLFD